MSKKLKSIPAFRDEAEERRFWETHDSSEYVDWRQAAPVRLPNLKPKPRIMVFGVGGAGGNAVNNMIECGLEGVEFVVANTDAQALSQSKAQRRIQMGESATQGLGAGSHPEVGRGAAQEAIDEIKDHLSGCHMVFVTAGMGGGIGTGAAPVIARAAKEMGILTVAVVTKPFQFEGLRRMRIAQEGLIELERHVDTLLVIPNQNLFRVANEETTFAEAFAMADQVLFSGISGITDLMVAPGLINLDFADVCAVIGDAGTAMMGIGDASGGNRAIEAAEAAISNPLLEDVSMAGAKGVLINIIGGSDLTLYEVDEAANRVRTEVDPDANIIVGSTFNANLEGRMRVTVVVLKDQLSYEAAVRAVLLDDEDQATLLAREREEVAIPDLKIIRRHRDLADALSATGPTRGPAPSSWSGVVSRDATVAATTYALRFGTRNVWKIGHAQDVTGRLAEVNKHIPHEVLGEWWSLGWEQNWPNQTAAYEMEQRVLDRLAERRTEGERVTCTEDELRAAWFSALVPTG